jgi:hypothetical protein
LTAVFALKPLFAVLLSPANYIEAFAAPAGFFLPFFINKKKNLKPLSNSLS